MTFSSSYSGAAGMRGIIENEFKLRIPGLAIEEWREGQGTGNLFASKRLVRNAPYLNIYDCRSVSDLLYVAEAPRVRIELVSQQSSGSVDEKFPFWLMNAESRMPEPTVWLIIDGLGPRPGALRWLRTSAAKATKPIHIITTLDRARAAIATVA